MKVSMSRNGITFDDGGCNEIFLGHTGEPNSDGVAIEVWDEHQVIYFATDSQDDRFHGWHFSIRKSDQEICSHGCDFVSCISFASKEVQATVFRAVRYFLDVEADQSVFLINGELLVFDYDQAVEFAMRDGGTITEIGGQI